MSPSVWGPNVWIFFHTIVEKLKDDKFEDFAPQIFSLIRKISSNLPCPDCSAHASRFLSGVNFSHIKTKEDFRKLIYIFHNSVNRRKDKPLYNYSDMKTYSNNNVIKTYNDFISVFATKGNMKLLADNFQRKILITELKRWLLKNISIFS